jgi:hypothetical protein
LFVGEGTQPAGETLVAVYEAIAQGPGRFDIQGPVGHTVCDELALNRWGRNPVLYNAGREIRLLDERFVLAGNRLAVFRDELEPVCPDVLDE